MCADEESEMLVGIIGEEGGEGIGDSGAGWCCEIILD